VELARAGAAEDPVLVAVRRLLRRACHGDRAGVRAFPHPPLDLLGGEAERPVVHRHGDPAAHRQRVEPAGDRQELDIVAPLAQVQLGPGCDEDERVPCAEGGGAGGGPGKRLGGARPARRGDQAGLVGPQHAVAAGQGGEGEDRACDRRRRVDRSAVVELEAPQLPGLRPRGHDQLTAGGIHRQPRRAGPDIDQRADLAAPRHDPVHDAACIEDQQGVVREAVGRHHGAAERGHHGRVRAVAAVARRDEHVARGQDRKKAQAVDRRQDGERVVPSAPQRGGPLAQHPEGPDLAGAGGEPGGVAGLVEDQRCSDLTADAECALGHGQTSSHVRLPE
jgi:hypothetical protein